MSAAQSAPRDEQPLPEEDSSLEKVSAPSRGSATKGAGTKISADLRETFKNSPRRRHAVRVILSEEELGVSFSEAGRRPPYRELIEIAAKASEKIFPIVDEVLASGGGERTSELSSQFCFAAKLSRKAATRLAALDEVIGMIPDLSVAGDRKNGKDA